MTARPRQTRPVSVNSSRANSFRWPQLGYGLALVLVVIVVFAHGMYSPFIYDDSFSVVENPSIKKLWPLIGNELHPGPLNPARDLPTSGRPLVNLTLALNYRFGQLDPFGYHVFNLVVHALSGLLLFGLVRRALLLECFGNRFAQAAQLIAFSVALLWLVHPLQTEAVVYVTQRTELMVGLFYFATLYCSLRYWVETSPRGQNIWLALAILANLAGMACKEIMVTAPLIVLLFQRTLLADSFAAAIRKSWPLYLGLISGWLLLAALNINAPRGATAGFGLGLPAYIWWFTQAKILWLYLKLVIWPYPLSIHYPLQFLSSWNEAWPWLLATCALAVVILFGFFYLHRAWAFLGICAFAVLGPTLIVPITTEAVAERRMYLPLAAIITLLALAGYSAIKRSAALVALAIVFAAILSLVSMDRLKKYDDALALWQDAADHYPEDHLIQVNLANVQIDRGNRSAAISYLRHAIELQTNYADAHYNLGVLLYQTGTKNEALAELRRAIELDPKLSKAHNDLGFITAADNHPAEAIPYFKMAIQTNPQNAKAYFNLADALVATGSPQEAVLYYLKALDVQPDFMEACAHLALTYETLGKWDEAVATGEKAIRFARAQGHSNVAKNIELWLQDFRAQHPQLQNKLPPPPAPAQ